MEHLKAIIIDDEKSARNVLGSLLSKSPTPVKVIGEASNLPDAVTLIKRQSPDLVFLDVEMPGFAGYEIVNFFDEINFKIIFTTAYDQYALKAFEISAVDYILKPINRIRLYDSIQKVKQLFDKSNEIQMYQSLLENLSENSTSKIVISEIGGKQILKLKNIITFKAEGAYTIINMKNNIKITVSKNLKYFESVLSENNCFIRTHKSWIINKEHLVSYQPSKLELLLIENNTARISKNKIDDFEVLI